MRSHRNTDPGVSVIIPVHSAADFLREALASIVAQTFDDFEVIAVENGSTDNSLQILEDYREKFKNRGVDYRIVNRPDAGAASAKNVGLHLAHGKLLAFVDGDDRCDPEMLSCLTKAIGEYEYVALVFSRVRYIDRSGHPTGYISLLRALDFDHFDILVDNPIHSTSGTIVRTEIARKIGGFDENLTAFVDVDFAIRVSEQSNTRIHGLDRILVDYRRHDGQITSNWRRMRDNWIQVFEKAAARDPAAVNRLRREAYARNGVYWATLAYQARQYADAREQILIAWLRAADKLILDRHAIIRALACMVSLLPDAFHSRLAAMFNRD